MIRIGITGVNPFDGNRGVGALSYSIIHILNQIQFEMNQSFELYLIINGSGLPKKCSLTIGNQLYEVHLLPVVSVFMPKHFLKLLVYFKDFLTYLKLDYILDASYGDSYSDIYGAFNFRCHNSIKRFFSLLRKRQALLPQTIGPFFDPRVQKEAFKEMGRMQLILPRDKMSLEVVQRNVPGVRSVEMVDMAFFMPYNKDELFRRKGEIHVGIGVSKLLWNNYLNKVISYKDDYQKLISKMIDGFLESNNVIIHLVPHVVCENDSKGNDYELCYSIWKAYQNERVILSPFFLDPIKAKNYISSLDFFTGSRMHACIAAFSSGVPVFPVAYSRKFIGLFNETLEYEHVGDLMSMNNDQILDRLFNAFAERDAIKAIIQDRMTSVVEEKRKVLYLELKRFLRS